MNEKLFQFIWKFSLFKPEGLKTSEGEIVTVIFPGIQNHDAGPDFVNAKVKIGNTTWIGNIELHIKASDWYKHGHQYDKKYSNIILHVCYRNDVTQLQGAFPILAMEKYIDDEVVKRYIHVVENLQPIPCGKRFMEISTIVRNGWLQRMLLERWEKRRQEWTTLWLQLNKDWKGLLYCRLAANFGFKVNQTPFLALALSLPLKIISKHRGDLQQIEALLFGQSGLLNEKTVQDDYSQSLWKEYQYLANKYQLQPIDATLWKFMRMRPANFPTIRISQFAYLLYQSQSLFSKMIDFDSKNLIQNFLNTKASEYWNTHFRFGVAARNKEIKKIGGRSVQNIVINTISPLQYFYAKEYDRLELQEASIDLLEAVPPEENKYMKYWQKVGMEIGNASESQSLLHLYTNYCTLRRCLDCSIGVSLVKR